MRPPWERVGGFAGILCFAKERTLLHAPGVIQPRSGSWRHCKHQPVSLGVVPAKAGIHGKPIWNLRFLLAWIPACAGMTVTHRVSRPFTWQVKGPETGKMLVRHAPWRSAFRGLILRLKNPYISRRRQQ